MPALRCACLIAVLICGVAAGVAAQNDKVYPSDEEIRLLLTQTDRAVQRYKPLLDEEENQIGKSAVDDAANDTEAVAALETSLKSISAQRGYFNGTRGFEFLQRLDDADRSALRCGFAASSQATGYSQK